MCARSDQVVHRGSRILASDEALADKDGIGAGLLVQEQIVRDSKTEIVYHNCNVTNERRT